VYVEAVEAVDREIVEETAEGMDVESLKFEIDFIGVEPAEWKSWDGGVWGCVGELGFGFCGTLAPAGGEPGDPMGDENAEPLAAANSLFSLLSFAFFFHSFEIFFAVTTAPMLICSVKLFHFSTTSSKGLAPYMFCIILSCISLICEERSNEWKVVSYVGRRYKRGAKRQVKDASNLTSRTALFISSPVDPDSRQTRTRDSTESLPLLAKMEMSLLSISLSCSKSSSSLVSTFS